MISKILCAGMATCDITVKPVPDNILSIDNCQIDVPVISGGGDALNVARTLARLDVNVSLCSRISRDMFGDTVVNELNRFGVNTSGVFRENQNGTAVSFALVDESGERHFATSKKIFNEIREADVTDELLLKHDAIYFGSAMQMKSMDYGGIQKLFRRAHDNHMITFMDAAANESDRPWSEVLDGALHETDYFLPSFTEAEAITGESEPKRQAEFFRKYNMKAVVIKLGSKGCFVTDFREEQLLPPIKVVAVDTTGAGDCFVAGFLCACSKGLDVIRSAEFANAVAALSVSGTGTMGRIEGYEQTLEFYKTADH